VQRLRALEEHFTFWLLSKWKTQFLKEMLLESALREEQGVLIR
jgi:hypothetical protein